MAYMMSTSLVAAVAPRTGKIIRNGVFERGESMLQNGILHFVFIVSCQKLRWKVEILAETRNRLLLKGT